MATPRRRWLRSLAVAPAVALLSWPALVASADTVAFTIRDERVTESSGLVRDTDADLYWTVNDSGDEGTVYGVTDNGNVKGIVGFRAEPVDVEAVAMYEDRLYVADIGDNGSKRDFVTVYYFNNPEPNNRTVPFRSYDFSYPDGPHDAETLLVDGDGRLYIVTKGIRGAVYQAPRRPSRQGVNELKKVADAPAYVTDGVFLPDGDEIALRTYVSVEVLDASSYKTVALAAAPYQRQGESIAVALDGKSLLVGSEGKRSTVLEIDIPGSVGDAPSAGSAPPKSATPTPTPSTSTPTTGDDQMDDDEGPPVSRAGTILSLSLAGLVALVAGVVVAARRK
jgi:hypothetical protein